MTFTPYTLLRNPHIQTLLSYVIKRYDEPESETMFVELEDGDKLALEVTTPKGWKDSNLTVLLMHGVGGSHKSPYLVRMASKLCKQNIRTVRLNFRGTATGIGLAKKITHGGSSEDVHTVLKALKQQHPASPITTIGFSLSGNILLKLAGEKDLSKLTHKLITVCPPLSLFDSSQRLEKFQNRIYQNSIVKAIVEILGSSKNQFVYKPKRPLSSCKTLKEIDDLFTAPASGYNDAFEYYTNNSCLKFIPKITSPCHILFASDDPIVNGSKIQEIKVPSNIEVVTTRYGGHIGFLKNSFKNPFWMDEILIKWLQ